MKLLGWRDPVYFYMREPGILSKDGRDVRGLFEHLIPAGDFIVFRYMPRREAMRVALGMLWAALKPDPRWRW